jgi:pilus assembly protein CpaE
MDVSDLIILITAQDIPSIKNARLYLDLADGLGIAKDRIMFTMNKFDKRIGITPEKVGESFKHEVAAVFPAEDRIVLPAINRGVPFMLSERSSAIAKSINALADQISQQLTKHYDEEPEDIVVSMRR